MILAITCSLLRAQTAPSEGLDALSDDVVLNELAQRGMDSLLEYAFKTWRVPREKQDGIRTLIALRRLGDSAQKMNAAERRKLITEIVNGIEAAIPSMRDPVLLMRQSSDLISAGIERDVNTLEYWGESATAQGALRPVAQTVLRLLEQAQLQATRQADEASNRIRNPEDAPNIARYEKLEQLAREAEYTRHMATYFLVIAQDRADPSRRQMAAQSIEYLSQFDTPDQPIRARVRNRIGKLAMLTGDFDAARAMFDMVIRADAKDFQTPPDQAQQYEARYFRAVTELFARKPDNAEKLLAPLEAWQKQNLPESDRSARQGAAAAEAMLQYRIHSLRAEMESDAARQKAANEAAVAVLLKLMTDQPALKSIIYEQLIGKLPSDAPMNSLDPLLLQAIVQRGETEMRRTEGASDVKLLQRAVAAAVELASRSGIDPQLAENASLLVGFLKEKLGEKQAATESLLGFIERHRESKNAIAALDAAQSLVAQLRSESADDPTVTKLYERFLKLAINPPFGRNQFAYEFARRLQLQGNATMALEYFRRVQPDDPRALQARFYQTIALQQELESLSATDPRRAVLLADIQKSANEVSGNVSRALAAATTDEQRLTYRSMLVRTTLLAAELARAQQGDPKRALQLLSDFEKQVEGLPDAPRRLSEMLLIRVESYITADQYADATSELVKLLEREPDRGGRIVYELLQRLNEELERAQREGNAASVRHIADDRARLTGFLVDWARKSSSASVRKLTYGYAVFDAEVQRFAAEQQPDPAQREVGLRKALALFQSLEDDKSLAEYRATLSPELAANPPAYDASVMLGLARAYFDLGEFQQARDRFSRLLTDKRLGQAMQVIEERGVQKQIDNDTYWEAVVKLVQANVKLNAGVEESKTYLKQQIIRWGDHAGGVRWKSDFAKLRAELIPDFNSEAPATTTGAG